ncbi:hypothetical protein AVEN_59390-1 [Araneus ventricosus]|uniref:Uncharacterized protein n=1 Tax=Araneus ventricosus TaxID=182803 RepID=A0A4Y2LII9_ARAVE|nr:hypothetical protein AVEN_59390-1 [Araneus ventricosus]
MSDDADQFYNAWVSLFRNKPQKVLCIWLVDRAWCQKINTIPDVHIRAKVYGKHCLLRNESCEEKFEELLKEVKNDFKEMDALKNFSEYFETYYAKRCEQWALCFRKGAFISTNMCLEAYHKIFKHIYLKGESTKDLIDVFTCSSHC